MLKSTKTEDKQRVKFSHMIEHNYVEEDSENN